MTVKKKPPSKFTADGKRGLHGPKRTRDREATLAIICGELRKGYKTMRLILSELDPPMINSALQRWRRDNPDIEEQISEAFEEGMDRAALIYLNTARGLTESQGGMSSDDVLRDRLICTAQEKLLQNWSVRYAVKVYHANDPNNPLTNVKPTDVDDDELLGIALRDKTNMADDSADG